MMNAYFDALRALVQPIRASAWELTLEPMQHLLTALDQPEQAYRAVVVTGSTGKGTSCLRIATALSAAGLRVGLYTSPHLHLFRERFALLESDNASRLQIISQAEFTETAQTVLDAERVLDHSFSTFESATALALVWFAQQQIDVALLEVGIGGRFDAVNAVANDLAVFTPIEAEHVAMLGGSLESVAWHKAGIIQPHGKAISLPQVPEVWTVLEREAREKGAVLTVYDNLITGMGRGGFQTRPHDETAQAIALPGRLEQVTVGGRSVIIDGGHTPRAAQHLREFIGLASASFADAPIRLVVGMLGDKNVAAYLSSFDTPNVHLIYTRAPSDRALSHDDLLDRYRPHAAHVTLIESLDDALRSVNQADEALIVVAGSLRMAAAARETFGLLPVDDLEEARLTHTIFEGAEYRSKLG